MPKGFQAGVGFGRWRTSSRRVIEMKEMSDRHLQNAIKICKQHGGGKLRELQAELKHREDPRFDMGVW